MCKTKLLISDLIIACVEKKKAHKRNDENLKKKVKIEVIPVSLKGH